MIKDLSKTLADLEKGLQIDEHALNECLIEQPQIYWQVAKQHAISVSERDAAKQNLAEVEAEVDLEIRQEAARLDAKGPTEKAIECGKRLDKRVIKAVDELQKLNHEVNLFAALKDAFQSRGYVLKDLTQLFIANYYSESSQDNAQRSMKDHRVVKGRDQIGKRYDNR